LTRRKSPAEAGQVHWHSNCLTWEHVETFQGVKKPRNDFAGGGDRAQTGGLGNISITWSIAQTGDYDGDGMTDLLWRDTSGNTSIWFMSGTTVASTGAVGNIPTTWTVQSINAE
jgi:hypothetical protein